MLPYQIETFLWCSAYMLLMLVGLHYILKLAQLIDVHIDIWL